jgi:hypothetical protein
LIKALEKKGKEKERKKTKKKKNLDFEVQHVRLGACRPHAAEVLLLVTAAAQTSSRKH